MLEGWGSFLVEPSDEDRTRLISRSRVPKGWSAVSYSLLLETPHFVMQRKMLLGIKERACAMTLTVLVPLDGSPLAARALPFAASLVADGDGRLALAHVQSSLGRRLVHRPEPIAVLAFAGPNGQREIEASFRVQLGPLGPTLASSRAAPTPDRAAHLAIQAVERQLERQVAGQRGEPSYGVPSRRRLGGASGGGEVEAAGVSRVPDDA
jgi:hypothetical protein